MVGSAEIFNRASEQILRYTRGVLLRALALAWQVFRMPRPNIAPHGKNYLSVTVHCHVSTIGYDYGREFTTTFRHKITITFRRCFCRWKLEILDNSIASLRDYDRYNAVPALLSSPKCPATAGTIDRK